MKKKSSERTGHTEIRLVEHMEQIKLPRKIMRVERIETRISIFTGR